MHKTRNLFSAKMAQKGFRVSDFALFLCGNCYRIFILQQPHFFMRSLLYFTLLLCDHFRIGQHQRAHAFGVVADNRLTEIVGKAAVAVVLAAKAGH